MTETGQKIISVHQPNFFPWAGFFHKMAMSDVFILLDDVQFSKNSFINRSQVLVEGEKRWLTVPAKPPFGTAINAVELRDLSWKNDHINFLENAYRDAPHFSKVWSFIKALYEEATSAFLCENNIHFITAMAKQLAINTPMVRSSCLQLTTYSDPTERLIKLVEKCNGKAYLSGVGAKNYQNESLFGCFGIELKYSSFELTNYPQKSSEFVVRLSILDMLFNLGWKSTAKYFQEGA